MFIGTIVVIPYILPSWSVAMAWIIAFRNNRIGHGAAGVIQSLTGIVTPDWLVYGQFPIIAVLSLNYFAFAYLLGAAAFSSIDASLEEAAMIQGAPGKTYLRKITLPLILPAIGSAFILTFARGLGNFAVPALLGFPVRYYVLSTNTVSVCKHWKIWRCFCHCSCINFNFRYNHVYKQHSDWKEETIYNNNRKRNQTQIDTVRQMENTNSIRCSSLSYTFRYCPCFSSSLAKFTVKAG